MYDDHFLVRMADMGMTVARFKDSDIGKFLLAKARSEAIAAMHELKEVDPHDFKSIGSIQGRIKLAESFEIWLEEGISNGLMAQEQISIAQDDWSDNKYNYPQ